MNNLSIQKKILLILLAASIGFIIYLIANTWAMQKSRGSLNTATQAHFPSLLLTNSTEFLLEKLNDQLQLAVTTGDEELISQADKTKNQLDENLTEILRLNPDNQSQISNTQISLADLFRIARNIAQSMVDGSTNFDNIQNQVKQKNIALENVRHALTSLSDQQNKQLSDAISDANANASSALKIGIIICISTIALLSVFAIPIALSVSSKLNSVTHSLTDMSSGSGDLHKRIPNAGDDEVGKLVNAFNQFVSNLQNTVQKVIACASPLLKISDELKSIANNAKDQMHQQKNASDDTRSAVEEMHHNIKTVADNTETASTEAKLAEETVNKGLAVVISTKDTIAKLANDIDAASSIVSQLEADSGSVGMILDVIRGIAEQTNLLALNAAIEAARAGEQGRGFAVVADEVRSLASKTQQSTQEINNLISQLQQNASRATASMTTGTEQARASVDSVHEVSQQFEIIANSIKNIRDVTQQVSATVEGETALAEKIVQHVHTVDAITARAEERTSALIESSHSLTQQAEQLKQTTSQFKT